jgi:hypothetical protein
MKVKCELAIGMTGTKDLHLPPWSSLTLHCNCSKQPHHTPGFLLETSMENILNYLNIFNNMANFRKHKPHFFHKTALAQFCIWWLKGDINSDKSPLVALPGQSDPTPLSSCCAHPPHLISLFFNLAPPPTDITFHITHLEPRAPDVVMYKIFAAGCVHLIK